MRILRWVWANPRNDRWRIDYMRMIVGVELPIEGKAMEIRFG